MGGLRGRGVVWPRQRNTSRWCPRRGRVLAMKAGTSSRGRTPSPLRRHRRRRSYTTAGLRLRVQYRRFHRGIDPPTPPSSAGGRRVGRRMLTPACFIVGAALVRVRGAKWLGGAGVGGRRRRRGGHGRRRVAHDGCRCEPTAVDHHRHQVAARTRCRTPCRSLGDAAAPDGARPHRRRAGAPRPGVGGARRRLVRAVVHRSDVSGCTWSRSC